MRPILACLLIVLPACTQGIPRYATPKAGACAEPEFVSNAWLPESHSVETPAWPNASDLGEEGYEVGDTVANFRLQDQNGDEVCAWQFGGRAMVIDVSALDCGPCQAAAEETDCLARDFGAENFAYLTILRDHLDGNTAEPDDLQEWKEYFEIDEPNTPLLLDPGSIWSAGLTDNPPAFVVVNADLQITGVQFGFDASSGDEDLRKLVAEALGTNEPYPHGKDFCEH